MKNKLSTIIVSLLFVLVLLGSCFGPSRDEKIEKKIDKALINNDFQSAHEYLMELERNTIRANYYPYLERVYSAECAWLVENGQWDQAYFILLNLPRHRDDSNEAFLKKSRLRLFQILRNYAIELDNEEMVQRVDKKLKSLENE